MRLMTQIRFLFTAICLLALSQSSVAFGQSVYGSIYGTVTDATGAVVPGANVTVTDVAKGTTVTVQSNGSGDFTVDHLIPDIYDVKIDAGGFKGYQQKGIQVFADTAVKVTAALEVGASEVTVEVNADAVPQLKTDRADVSTNFGSREIEDLPIPGRNFTGLAAVASGRAAAWMEPRRQRESAGQQTDHGRWASLRRHSL